MVRWVPTPYISELITDTNHTLKMNAGSLKFSFFRSGIRGDAAGCGASVQLHQHGQTEEMLHSARQRAAAGTAG